MENIVIKFRLCEQYTIWNLCTYLFVIWRLTTQQIDWLTVTWRIDEFGDCDWENERVSSRGKSRKASPKQPAAVVVRIELKLRFSFNCIKANVSNFSPCSNISSLLLPPFVICTGKVNTNSIDAERTEHRRGKWKNELRKKNPARNSRFTKATCQSEWDDYDAGWSEVENWKMLKLKGEMCSATTCCVWYYRILWDNNLPNSKKFLIFNFPFIRLTWAHINIVEFFCWWYPGRRHNFMLNKYI